MDEERDQSDYMERDISLSDDDILSINQLERLQRLKRMKGEDENDADEEDGYTKVRLKPKKLFRSSKNVQITKPIESPFVLTTNTEVEMSEICEIGISSTEPLPKQMALAKLLRSQNVIGIIKIKYKSIYRVQLTFDSKEKAESISNCEELKKRGFRFLKSDEMDLCYGIVRQVDLEIKDEELKNIFDCKNEIVSVWRWKRRTIEGNWVDSETIRICFRSHTVPPFVEAYGCRFIVEPYIFPVSQCSGCWRYGHRIKFCPVKKILCPKCGSNHANCETKEYKCINCKGPHMSVEKSKCSMYQKEKDIRGIMRDENSTYKKAFESFQEKEKRKHQEFPEFLVNTEPVEERYGTVRSYKAALLSGNIPQEENYIVSEEEEVISTKRKKSENQEVRKKQRKRKNKEKKNENQCTEKIIEDQEMPSESEKENGKPKRKEGFSFMRLFNKIKEIMSTEKMLEEKITKVLSVVFLDCYSYIAEWFNGGDWVYKLLSIFYNG